MISKKMTIKGVVHGRTIQLEAECGIPEGQQVSVTVEPIVVRDEKAIFEAFKAAAGGWENDDPEGLEEYLKWNREQRKVNRREIPE